MKTICRQAAAIHTGFQIRNLQSSLPHNTKTPIGNRLANTLQEGHQIRGKEASLTQIDKGACENHHEVTSLKLQVSIPQCSQP